MACILKFFQKFHTQIFVLGVIILVLIGYAPFYLNGGFLGDLGDPIGQTVPNKFLVIEYLKNGILPLWNPFSFLGFPLLADIQVGTFYVPDLIIFWLLPTFHAHNFSVLLHILFGGIGIFFLIRALSKSQSIVSESIALALACTMALGGSFLARIVYLNFLETIVFIPWILFLIVREKTSFAVLALILTAMIFAGHPVALFYSLIIIGIFILINARTQWKKCLLALFLSLLLAGIQIIPFLSLQSESIRERLSYEQFIDGSLREIDLLNFINPLKGHLSNAFDMYIHFGTIALILLAVSVLFWPKFSKNYKKIYGTGLVLFVLGILLSLGGTIPWLAKLLYHLPVASLFRVPARYIVVSHFGAILALWPFLFFLFQKNKILGSIIQVLLIVNALLIPSLFLDRFEIAAAKQPYGNEIRTTLEKQEHQAFSLTTPPHYFLSSSFFLFPNRHVLWFMPSIIGYNPLILKNFKARLPVDPGGSFRNPDYFKDYYEVFETVGLSYFIFPTESFIEKKLSVSKKHIFDLLQQKGWKVIATIGQDIMIWKHPNPKPFAFFLNDQNTIQSTFFRPGFLKFEVNIENDDTLVVNQIFMKDWVMTVDNKNISTPAQPYKYLVQSYQVPQGTHTITLAYRPKSLLYGGLFSLFGLILLGGVILWKRKYNIPNP